MKKTIIFDLGGVLVIDGVYPMIRHLTGKFSLDRDEVKKFVIKEFDRLFEGAHTELAFWEKFGSRFGVNTQPAVLEKRLNEYYGIKKDTIKLIAALRKKGYSIGFLSNSVKEIVEYLERKYGISKLFDFGIYSHNVKTRKPGKKIFRMIIRKAGVRPGEIIFLDDKAAYAKGARSVGIKTILFKSAAQAARSLRKMGVAV